MSSQYINSFIYTDDIHNFIKSYRIFESTQSTKKIYQHINFKVLKYIIKNHIDVNRILLNDIIYSVINENDIIELSTEKISSSRALTKKFANRNFSLKRDSLIEFIDNDRYYIGLMIDDKCYILNNKAINYNIEDLKSSELERVVFKYFSLISKNKLNNEEKIIKYIKTKCQHKISRTFKNSTYLQDYNKTFDEISKREEDFYISRRCFEPFLKREFKKKNFHNDVSEILLNYFMNLLDTQFKNNKIERFDKLKEILKEEKNILCNQVNNIEKDIFEKIKLSDHKTRINIREIFNSKIIVECDRYEIYKLLEGYSYSKDDIEKIIAPFYIRNVDHIFNTKTFNMKVDWFHNKYLKELENLINIAVDI